jgi:KRAB domain-containing zinc finger protein
VNCVPSPYTSYSKREMSKHSDGVHLGKKDFQCHLCDKTFSVKPSLVGHIDTVHSQISKYSCVLCDYSTSRRYDLEHQKRHLAHHIISKHENQQSKKDFMCGHCDKTFTRKGHLAHHIISKHENQQSNIRVLSKTVHVVQSIVHLEVHAKTVHLKKYAFKCDLCDKGFISKSTLTNHVNAVHKKITRFSCELCDYSSYTRQQLVLHSSVHGQTKNFKCDHCDKGFSQNSSLTDHIKCVHEKMTRYKCELCDYSSYTRQKLAVHLSVHGQTKKIMCDHCDKGFSQNGNLKEHIKRVHKKMTRYSCELCPYTSYTKREMSKHSDGVHLGKKDFQCHLCDKAFSVKPSLVGHMYTVHPKMSNMGSNNPTFQCDMCDMTFKGKAELCAHKDILDKCSFTFVNVTADNPLELNKDPIDEDMLHTEIEVKIEPI